MSHIPQIMKTIAKRILSKSSTQRDVEDKDSNDHPMLSENQHPKNPEECEPCQQNNQQTEKVQINQRISIFSEDEIAMKKAMQFFIAIQKRRLNCLYPNFKQSDVDAAATKSWQDLLPEQKQIYMRKSKLNEDEQIQQLELLTKMNQEAMKAKRNSKIEKQEGQISQSDEETQTKHQKPLQKCEEVSQENSKRQDIVQQQSLSSLQQGEVGMSRQLSNNDETNSSSVAGDRPNTQVVLTTVQTLAQASISEIADSDIHQPKLLAIPNAQPSDNQNQASANPDEQTANAQFIGIGVELVSNGQQPKSDIAAKDQSANLQQNLKKLDECQNKDEYKQ